MRSIIGDIDLRTLLTTLVENLHTVSHLKNETFTALQYAQDFGTISKESLKRTTKWGAKYFTHEKSYYPVLKSSMELEDVNVMKPPPVVSIDPQIETAMKELVDRYRPVRQRTVRSETTKDKAAALPPAVYSSQPSDTKVIFHEDAQDDSVTENREGIEQNTRMPPSADYDHGIAGITFVDESVVAVAAVADMTDLPVQEATSFPGSLLFTPQEAREGRPWLGLVTCLPKSGRLQISDWREGRLSVSLPILSVPGMGKHAPVRINLQNRASFKGHVKWSSRNP